MNVMKSLRYIRYFKTELKSSQALLEVSSQLGHSDLRITERYACSRLYTISNVVKWRKESS